MKRLPLILGILFYCSSAASLPSGFCEAEPNDDRESPYYGPDSIYRGDLHLGWYDPDLFMKDAMKYSGQKYGVCVDWCNSLAEDNVDFMARQYLWQEVITTRNEKVRDSCGGAAKCDEPYLAPNVKCYVEEVDCEDMTVDEGCHALYFKLVRTYYLECRGDLSCEIEHKSAKDCCIVTGVREANGIPEASTHS